MTDEQLTAIYNEANGITGKRLPITTARIFTAMRAVHVAAFRDGYEKGVAAFHEAVAMEREACAKVCDQHAENMARHGDTALAEQSRQDAVAIRMRSNYK